MILCIYCGYSVKILWGLLELVSLFSEDLRQADLSLLALTVVKVYFRFSHIFTYLCFVCLAMCLLTCLCFKFGHSLLTCVYFRIIHVFTHTCVSGFYSHIFQVWPTDPVFTQMCVLSLAMSSPICVCLRFSHVFIQVCVFEVLLCVYSSVCVWGFAMCLLMYVFFRFIHVFQV